MMPLPEQPPVVGRSVVDGRREGALGGEVVPRDEGTGPCGVGEVAGELAPRVGRGDHVASAIEVHDRRLAVPRSRRSPKTSHCGGVLEKHALGLRGHVLGVLARLSLVWEIHIHGLRGVTQ